MIPRRVLSVFAFECWRTFTWTRIGGWLLLVAFPIFIVTIMKYYDAQADPMAGLPHLTNLAWGMVFFALIPEVISLFGLLLWATPVVHAEMEGRTWIYLAVRPKGRVSVLLGKYLAAVVWTSLAGWCSATICVWIVQPAAPMRMWGVMVLLVALSCAAYGALYAMIGTLFHQRAMVIAVGYTLVFEFIVSMIPALFNKFTISYRLRNLLFYWLDLRGELSVEGATVLLGNESVWVHLAVLVGMTATLLVVAMQIIQRKEYATTREV